MSNFYQAKEEQITVVAAFPEYEEISAVELSDLSLEAGRMLSPREALEYLRRARTAGAVADILKNPAVIS